MLLKVRVSSRNRELDRESFQGRSDRSDPEVDPLENTVPHFSKPFLRRVSSITLKATSTRQYRRLYHIILVIYFLPYESVSISLSLSRFAEMFHSFARIWVERRLHYHFKVL